MASRTRIGLLAIAVVAVAVSGMTLTAAQERGQSQAPAPQASGRGTVAAPSTARAGAESFIPGEILVTFRPGTNASAKADVHRQAGGTRLAEIARTGVQRVRIAPGDESAAMARYQRNPNVLYAEPNFVRRIPMPLAHTPGTEVVPGDYYFDEQWGLHNTGQQFYCIPWGSGEVCAYVGTPDADVDAPEAWAISTGSFFDIKVAVIDSGVDYNHPDLAANYVGGADFVFNDGDPMDDHGHGTHVAGTIAAAMNNLTGAPADEEGVAGVAPNARILAYKVCSSDGSCSDFAIQQAIAQAITDGAIVINLSLGETGFSQSLNDAVQGAWNAGLLIVAGAGNNGTTELFYPAALNNVISVAAFDEDHRRASFSNYGTWVDISAPGNVIMSTYPLAACGGSTVPGDIGCYNWNSGTSMATPHVAGAAALVWSRNDVTTNGQVMNILLNSADAQGVDTVRLDSWTIHGGLNIHNALSYALNTGTGPTAPANLTASASSPTRIDLSWTDQSSDELGFSVERCAGTAASCGTSGVFAKIVQTAAGVTSYSDTTAQGNTTYSYRVRAFNVSGNSEYSNVAEATTPSPAPPPTVTVTATTPTANEAGPTNGVFTISRETAADTSLSVSYSISGTANGTDYQTVPTTATIPAGMAAINVSIVPINDSLVEPAETVILTFSASSSYVIGWPSSATVTIVSDDRSIDFAVTSLTVPAVGGAGAAIQVTDTTKNQGADSSLPSLTSFYLSSNLVIDAGDPQIGTRDVPVLAAGTSNAATTSLTIPSTVTAGSYYLIAKADGPGQYVETNENNNTRYALIKIGPDFVVSAMTAPSTAAAGAVIAVSETTKNLGGGSSGPSSTRFHLSVNSLLDAGDVALQARTVGPLAAGASQAAVTNVTIPANTATGRYYLISKADDANAVMEVSETNNTRYAILNIGADLQIPALTAPSRAAATGAQISVNNTTTNKGGGPAGASTTAFFLSSNTTLDAGDYRLTPSRAIGPLAAGQPSSATTTVTLPAVVPGTWYLMANADDAKTVVETFETNNLKYTPIFLGPDLTVSALTVPSTAVAGTTITVTDTVKNIGPETAPGSTTRFYLSLNAVLDAQDIVLDAQREVPALGFNLTSMGSTSVTLPAGVSGRYYLLAIADGNKVVVEGNETNNVAARLITINP
jgi:subtilisin family serine protease